jgi:hypothetical protein
LSENVWQKSGHPLAIMLITRVIMCHKRVVALWPAHEATQVRQAIITVFFHRASKMGRRSIVSQVLK